MQKLTVLIFIILGINSCFDVKRKNKSKTSNIKSDLSRETGDQSDTALGKKKKIFIYPKIKISQSFNTTLSGSNDHKFLSDEGRVLLDVKNIQLHERQQAHIKRAIDATFFGIIKKNGEQSKVTQELLSTFVLTDWNKKNLYAAGEYLKAVDVSDDNSGYLKTKVKIFIDELKDISEISNINLEIGIYNPLTYEFEEIETVILRNDLGENVKFSFDGTIDRFNSSNHYNISKGWLDFAIIRKIVDQNLQIAVRIKDFDYKYKANNLKYSEVISRVVDERSLVIISNPSETKSVYVEEGSLNTILKYFHYNYKIAKDQRINIASFNKLRFSNNVNVYNYDYSKLNFTDFNKGAWLYYPTNFINSQKFKKGETYILHYAKLKNLYSSLNIKTTFKESAVENGTDFYYLDNVKIGDEYTIEISVRLNSPQLMSSSVSIPVSYTYQEKYDCVNPEMGGRNKRFCKYRTRTSSQSCTSLFQSVVFRLKDTITSPPNPYNKYFNIFNKSNSKMTPISFSVHGKYGSYVSGNKTTSFIKITPDYFKNSTSLRLVIGNTITGNRNLNYGYNGWTSCGFTGQANFSCNHATYCNRHNVTYGDISQLKIIVSRIGVER